MSTATSKPEVAAPPEVMAKPVPPTDREEETWAHEPEDRPADRTALLFWLIAFAILAFITLCDLVMGFFR
jgi:hypothetical protein